MIAHGAAPEGSDLGAAGSTGNAAGHGFKSLPQNRTHLRCGGEFELRICWTNNSCGWQCIKCGKQLGDWISRRELRGVNLERLPSWLTRAERRRENAPQRGDRDVAPLVRWATP